MGFFDDIVNSAKEQLFTGVNENTNIANTLSEQYPDKDIWSVSGQDWYKVYGYQFKILVKGDDGQTQKTFYFTLPIPPQSYQCKPVIPNKVTPTLGGNIEENSPVNFWVITMSGTTGTGISRAKGDESTRQKVAGQFRKNVSTTGLLSGVFSAVSRGIIDNTLNAIKKAKDAMNHPSLSSISEATGEVTGAINNALLPNPQFSSSSVDGTTNGFTEAEELQKFFYMYQRLKSDSPDKYSLYFVNHKTNQQWRVQVKDFQLMKNAQNPMLYRYNISLQGWDIKSSKADEGERGSGDRFGNDGDLKSVNTMAFNHKSVKNAISGIKKGLKF